MPKRAPVTPSKKKRVKISEEHIEERERMTTLAKVGALPPTRDANDGDDEDDDNIITCEVMSEPPEIDTTIAMEKPWMVRRFFAPHSKKLEVIKTICGISLICSLASGIVVGSLLISKVLSKSEEGVCSHDDGSDGSDGSAAFLETGYNAIMQFAVDPVINAVCNL